MTTLRQWEQMHANDPRIDTPACRELRNARRNFSTNYGRATANRVLSEVNAEHIANVRRSRAVLEGLIAIRERAETDPDYTAKQAALDYEVLSSERRHLQAKLNSTALKLERARDIADDPEGYAEAAWEKYPALVDRVPGLPPF
jgi:thioesterase domain-containing protein